MSQPLEEAFYESEGARLRRWLPWVHLFRGFRLATRWQNLLLAMLGLLLLTAGRASLSHLPITPDPLETSHRQYLSDFLLPVPEGGQASTIPPARPTRWPWEPQFFTPPLPTTTELAVGRTPFRPTLLLTPVTDLLSPASRLFARRNTWSQIADAALHVLLVLAVGALFGGAITRRVACEFALTREPGLRTSLQESVRGFLETFTAPLISLVGIGLLVACGRIVAWLGRIPGTEGAIAAALWGVMLLVGLLIALIVVGVAIAWPLMVVARSVEMTDSFDALNRSYNYVFVRPWYTAWMVLTTLAYGGVLLLFVSGLTALTLHFSEWTAAGPLSDEMLGHIIGDAPETVATSSGVPIDDRESWGRRLGGTWLRGLSLLLSAFVYSFFWTSATLIYLLLRRSVDGTDLDAIYVPKVVRSPDNPPLVGVPAVERREAGQSE